jgi:hypothetical protein
MSLKPLIVITGFAVLTLFGVMPQAAAQNMVQAPVAQSATPAQPSPHVRPRIEINPRPLLYRRCVDWYELQYRPSGTVLYPQMRCRWVRG